MGFYRFGMVWFRFMRLVCEDLVEIIGFREEL